MQLLKGNYTQDISVISSPITTLTGVFNCCQKKAWSRLVFTVWHSWKLESCTSQTILPCSWQYIVERSLIRTMVAGYCSFMFETVTMPSKGHRTWITWQNRNDHPALSSDTTEYLPSACVTSDLCQDYYVKIYKKGECTKGIKALWLALRTAITVYWG